MGYSHGTSWDDERIASAILDVASKLTEKTMPTHSQMDELTGSCGLSNAVSRHGGTVYWANKLQLDTKFCESALGYEFELRCRNRLADMGYDCQMTQARYPYDILVNRNIKVDVKVGNLYTSKNGSFYTFNLEKSMPTCDVFVCYCIDNDNVIDTLVIPSCKVSGNVQLSVGKTKSKYSKYSDAWWVFEHYDDFYKLIGA